MISVSVDRDRALVEFGTPLVLDEEDAWREALGVLADAGPHTVLDALTLDDEPEDVPAKRRRSP
jgi:hypothetical protein